MRASLEGHRWRPQGLSTPLMRLLPVALALLVLAGTPRAAETPAARTLKAGAAQLDITPELGALIVGGFSPIPAKHIHDPLFARALVLDDGTNRIAFVVCDNLGIARDAIDAAKQLIEQQSKLPGARVMVSSTHTHSGPPARPDNALPSDQVPVAPAAPPPLSRYQQFVARRIADAVQCAINNLEPAKIAWGSVPQPQHVFNRRWFVSDEAVRRNPFGGVDRVRMNPPPASPALEQPAGPTDPEFSFVSVQTKSGRPLSLFSAYSLHYVGGVPAADISADYFGVFNHRMRELLGAERPEPAFVSLLANGTSGNINNIDFRARRPPQRPYERMRAVAHELADAVFAAYQQLEYRDWVPLDARYQELSLATRRPPPELVARSRELLAQPAPAKPWHGHERIYANRVLQLADGPARIEVPLQVFRIGELSIYTVPAETFVETGLELKARSPSQPAFTVSLANGSFGYLPTPEHHALGGYETWLGTNRLEVEASTKIVSALLQMARELNPSPAP